MKSLFLIVVSIVVPSVIFSQSPIGKWKKISHISQNQGQTFDSHQALLKSRPCASEIIWEINEDGSFRLNASASKCDDNYRNIQQKLYAKTRWKFEGGIFTTSATNFEVGQSYKVSFNGNRMIMTGTNGQGVITYQRL